MHSHRTTYALAAAEFDGKCVSDKFDFDGEQRADRFDFSQAAHIKHTWSPVAVECRDIFRQNISVQNGASKQTHLENPLTLPDGQSLATIGQKWSDRRHWQKKLSAGRKPLGIIDFLGGRRRSCRRLCPLLQTVLEWPFSLRTMRRKRRKKTTTTTREYFICSVFSSCAQMESGQTTWTSSTAPSFIRVYPGKTFVLSGWPCSEMIP